MHPYRWLAPPLPPPGEVPPQAGIGVHFHERSEVVWFSLPVGSDAAEGGIQTHCP